MYCQYCDVGIDEENSSELTQMYNLCSDCFHDPDTLVYFGHGETINLKNLPKASDYPLLQPREEEPDSFESKANNSPPLKPIEDEEFESFEDWRPQKPR